MKIYTIRYLDGTKEIREFSDDFVLQYGTTENSTLRAYRKNVLEDTFENVSSYSIRETTKEYDNRPTNAGAVATPAKG